MTTVSRRQRYRVDLREMMVQCETNYLHLMRLMPLLAERDAVRLTLPAGDPAARGVSVRVLERCRYTTVLELEPERLHALLPSPALTVRLYHDARSAEVTGARPWRQVAARHAYPNPAMHQQDEKLQWNRHLAEWLRHVNEHGGLRHGGRSAQQQA